MILKSSDAPASTVKLPVMLIWLQAFIASFAPDSTVTLDTFIILLPTASYLSAALIVLFENTLGVADDDDGEQIAAFTAL